MAQQTNHIGDTNKMVTINKEFIPYEQALELKELGFDEECLKYQWIDQDVSKWMHDSASPSSFHTQKYWMEDDDLYSISIPTFSQAFRWFREKYGLYPHVEYVHNSDFFEWYVSHKRGVCKTYEKAELACLNRLIKIVKNK